MLRDLMAVQGLSDRLEGTAPNAVRVAGGAAEIVSKYGHRGGAGFWTARLPEQLWEAMATEDQAPHRG